MSAKHRLNVLQAQLCAATNGELGKRLSTDVLLVDIDAVGIATITFNRPKAKNAFTFAMLEAFQDVVFALGKEDSVRVIILTGSGDSFCTGTDLKELNSTTPENRGRGERKENEEAETRREKEPLPTEMKAWQGWFIAACPKPVICALNGMAVGMGAEFVTQCDIRIFSDQGKVNWIFGKRGLVPDMGAGTWLLPKLIGYHQALRLLYTAKFYDAHTLKDLGFAHEVVRHDDLMVEARREAACYLTQSPLALGMMKRQMYLGMERSVEEHLRMHGEIMQLCFASDDHHEGVQSFIKHRPAKFTGEMPLKAAHKYPLTAALMK